MYIINLFSFDFRIEYESIYFQYLELMHFETDLFVVVVHRIFSISQYIFSYLEIIINRITFYMK